MEFEEVKQIITFCRANGVSHIKFKDVELDMTPVLQEQDIKKFDEKLREISDENKLNDVDMLFFSSGQSISTEEREHFSKFIGAVK